MLNYQPSLISQVNDMVGEKTHFSCALCQRAFDTDQTGTLSVIRDENGINVYCDPCYDALVALYEAEKWAAAQANQTRAVRRLIRRALNQVNERRGKALRLVEKGA